MQPAGLVILAVAASIIIMLVKTKWHLPIGATLWAEDGNIFFNEAEHTGVSSIVSPYAGYLHIWPRLFSILATLFPITAIPIVLAAGWALGLALTISVIFRRFNAHFVPTWLTAACILLMALQPTNSETYFTITNTQWFLSVGLSVWILLEGSERNSWVDYVLLAMMSLTGPFCIVLAPMVAIKLYIQPGKVDVRFYAIYFACTLLQLTIFAGSGRATEGTIDPSLWNWLIAFKTFLLFGQADYKAPLAFWLCYLGGAVYVFARAQKPDGYRLKLALLLLLAAGLIYMSGLWSHKFNPTILNPQGGGARYFVPAYGLILVTIGLLFSSHRVIACTVLGLATLICWKLFLPFDRTDLQFQAYAKFAEVESSIIIPINPPSDWYPGWGIEANKPTKLATNTYSYDLKFLSNNRGSDDYDGTARHFFFSDSDPQLFLTQTIRCEHSPYIGLAIDIKRPAEGWSQLFWDANSAFSEKHSARRYYPAGRTTMFFAFPNSNEGMKVRLDPADTTPEVEIKTIKVYCLGATI
jgi:hypothetical protein